MRRFLLLVLVLIITFLPLQAQDFSLADILIDSASAEEAELTLLLFVIGEADPALLSSLSDPNANLTILAPSDQAFVDFMVSHNLSLSDLAANTELLNDIVYYHILDEKLSSAEIAARENLATLLPNTTIEVSISRNNVRLNRTGQILRDGFEANNGILHLIDEVLLPPNVLNQLNGVEATPEATEAASQNIVEILQSREDLSTLSLALQQNGLLETLSDSNENFTLFAPTNAAFEEAGLSADDMTVESLLYHAFDNPLLIEEFLSLTRTNDHMTTLQGADVIIRWTADGMQLNFSAHLLQEDILASNGILHIIDSVLTIPAEATPEATEGS
jgi:transforming growth factor-beta-induced protein